MKKLMLGIIAAAATADLRVIMRVSERLRMLTHSGARHGDKAMTRTLLSGALLASSVVSGLAWAQDCSEWHLRTLWPTTRRVVSP